MIPQLSSKQQVLLSDLAQLLDFGGNLIMSYKFDKRHKTRKSILISMVTATHNYSEGIFCLIKEARTNAAEALLRPLLETSINCAYVFTGKNFDNLKRFMAEDEYILKDLGLKIQNFLKTYPEVKDYAKEFANEDWNKFIKDKEKEIKKIKGKKYASLPRLPDLRERAHQVDLDLERIKGKSPKRRLKYIYLGLYWLFSSLEHLGSRGLNSFFSVDGKGNITVNLSGDSSSVERIAVATYSFYIYVLEVFAKKFELYNKSEFKIFKDKMKHFTQGN